MTQKLTNRQRVFVEEYLQCGVGSEAARRAGYSVRTAQEQASRLLSNVMVKQHIERRISELKATTDEVLLRLASHSRSSMEDFIGDADRIDLARARVGGKMHLIKKLKQRTTTIHPAEGESIETHEIELELYDAQAATVQLARLLGLFVERVQVKEEAKQYGLDPDKLTNSFEQALLTGEGMSGTGRDPA
jgi:phage terminase small subunit